MDNFGHPVYPQFFLVRVISITTSAWNLEKESSFSILKKNVKNLLFLKMLENFFEKSYKADLDLAKLLFFVKFLFFAKKIEFGRVLSTL